MKRWLRVRAILTLALLGLGLSAVAAATTETIIYPANGVIGLDPPDGMMVAPDFAGFVSDGGASIVIVEMPPEAFDEIAAKFNAEGLAAQMEVAGDPRQLTLNNGAQALLITGAQTAHGIDYRKWVLLARGPMTTALVTVQVPTSETHYSDAGVLAALKTLSIRANVSIETQIAALPFTIGDMAGFRPVRVLAGSSLLLTDGPAESYQDGSQPIVIIAASMGSDQRLGQMPEAEREQLARHLAGQLGFADLAMERVPDGNDDYVVMAGTGTDTTHKQPMTLRQVLRFGETDYVRIVCAAKPEQAIAARCDTIARSVTLKRPR